MPVPACGARGRREDQLQLEKRSGARPDDSEQFELRRRAARHQRRRAVREYVVR
jgi:hypothetical protein